jgi:hypothetical protein
MEQRGRVKMEKCKQGANEESEEEGDAGCVGP